jgi:N-dimethylarginine dimethylaminohydrolase
LDGGYKLRVYSEYDILRQVIVCEPRFMAIRQVINRIQEAFAEENIDTQLACAQFARFTNKLVQAGIQVIRLAPDRRFPEQVFTRDIGFVIGDRLFISSPEAHIRHNEIEILIQWLQRENIPYIRVPHHPIEGGDVIVDRDKVWVGLSGRTTEAAASSIKAHLPASLRLIPVEIDDRYLHLDCLFQPVSHNEALVYPKGIAPEALNLIKKHYDCITITDEEQFHLGTNIFSIGGKRVFSLPQNQRINAELEARGYQVMPVDLSEIIKSGGSFRCITLPLCRDDNLP